MCLDYGTPHRFRLAYAGQHLPVECQHEATLRHWLAEEMAAGCYTPDVYHPLLTLALAGLLARYDHIHPIYRAPDFPFCDVIQALGVVFGFCNGGPPPPSRLQQDDWVVHGHPIVHPRSYVVAWHVLTACVAPEQWTPYAGFIRQMFRHSGRDGLRFMAGLAMERQAGEQLMFTRQRVA